MIRRLLILFIVIAAAMVGIALAVLWPTITDDDSPSLRVNGPPAPEFGPPGDGDTDVAALRGIVLYLPGVRFNVRADSPVHPVTRVTNVFPSALRAMFPDHRAMAFSYAADGGVYLRSTTRQALNDSARALELQLRQAVADWPSDAGPPEIVLLAHSLGGAVAAHWAGDADAAMLSHVRMIVTFDSPVDGFEAISIPTAPLVDILVSHAGTDLQDGGEVARMRHGVLRADFVQYANFLDVIVPFAAAQTDDAFSPWEGLLLIPGCQDANFNHECVLSNGEVLDHLAHRLAQEPPLWSGQQARADPLP